MVNKSKNTEYSLLSNIIYSFEAIWSFKRRYVVAIISLIVLYLLGVVVSTYTPPIIIGVVEMNYEITFIYLIILGMIFVNLIYWGIDAILQQKVWTEYQTKFTFHIKDKIMKKCMTMPYFQLEDPNVVTMKDRASNASESTYYMVTTIYQMTAAILAFLLFGGILATLHPLIVILLLVSSLFYFRIMKFSREYQHKVKDKNAVIVRKLEYIRSISSDFAYAKEVRLFEMQPWIKQLFQLFFKEHYCIQNTIQKKVFAVDIGNCLLTLLRDGGAYIYLIYKISAGEISVSEFVLYFSIISTVATTMISVVEQFNMLKVHSLNIGDYRCFMNLESENKDGLKKLAEANNGLSIELMNVSFKYPLADDFVLRDINLSISANEKIAIVGTNGAGKTTLVKLICGMYQPTEGRIFINGTPLNEYQREEYFKIISAVFQHTHFLPLSIGENIGIADGNMYDRDKAINCLKLAGIWNRVERLPSGIDTKMCKDVVEDAVDFSGGELQKLMLARAIYKDSSLLILDEPTAALDPIAECDIYLKYNQLTKEKTSIYISHRLSSTRFCDKIILIGNGKILETGSHTELMAKQGEYAKMFDVQSYYYQETVAEI